MQLSKFNFKKYIAIFLILSFPTYLIFLDLRIKLHEIIINKKVKNLEPDYQIFKTIDKIYIINLDSQYHRYHNTVKQLESLNLPVAPTRFSAINGLDVKFIDINDHKSFSLRNLDDDTELLKGHNLLLVCNDKNDDNNISINLGNSLTLSKSTRARFRFNVI